jgi:hypothetical protein
LKNKKDGRWAISEPSFQQKGDLILPRRKSIIAGKMGFPLSSREMGKLSWKNGTG